MAHCHVAEHISPDRDMPHGCVVLAPECIGSSNWPRAIGQGAHADVYNGILNDKRHVAIKTSKGAHLEGSEGQAHILKRIAREVTAWQNLKHPNVTEFIGIVDVEQLPSRSLVSLWGNRGRPPELQTKANPDLDVLSTLVLDVASGLKYLHSKKIIHGDLKPSTSENRPVARITDFGLAQILGWRGFTAANTFTPFRYRAPELVPKPDISNEDEELTIRPTLKSDIFSFDLKRETALLAYQECALVCIKIGTEKPLKGDYGHINDHQWRVLEECWQRDPASRPDAPELKRLVAKEFIHA